MLIEHIITSLYGDLGNVKYCFTSYTSLNNSLSLYGLDGMHTDFFLLGISTHSYKDYKVLAILWHSNNFIARLYNVIIVSLNYFFYRLFKLYQKLTLWIEVLQNSYSDLELLGRGIFYLSHTKSCRCQEWVECVNHIRLAANDCPIKYYWSDHVRLRC